ncbi:hypothetical protein JCM14469_17540 [Desulfatiferula olefinivorans]
MDLLKRLGTLRGVHQEDLALNEPFIDFAARFADRPGTVCLMSGGDLDCARYHILATRPFLSLSARGTAVELCALGQTSRIEVDPFDALRLVLNHFRMSDPALPDPVAAGLFGYLAYDLKDRIERLPRTAVDDLGLPSLFMTAPSVLVIEDKLEKRTRLCVPLFDQGQDGDREAARRYVDEGRRKTGGPGGAFHGDGSFRSNFDPPAYMDCIRKIKDYIAAGDIYQVNMSQRFETPFAGDPFALFKALYHKNPAPFFAFVHAGDHVIVSTSPERFITLKGRHVETRPIKGTRPRGGNPGEDARLRQELAESPKDDAELSMIVDLMRNDIGKVCEGGSVTVREHKRVEAYANVYHLISIVDGVLDPGVDAVDLIRATFPGGSITGCPKIRSMEIIDELETRRRHIYTGSIGYIGFNDTLDLSIAIRTATIVNGRLVFSVGGGVVYDSDPEDEYHETLHKGRTLIDTLSASGKDGAAVPWVWIDGGLKPLDQALLPVADPGVQYGHGFFETLRADAGHIRYLEGHLARLERAWRDFFPRPFPEVSWPLVIDQVIRACGLSEQCAAVKIMALRGRRTEAPWDDHLVVSARPYTHRLAALSKSGLDLVTWPHRRHSFLADYKSMNYQYYYLAGIEARKAGGDEAMILNADGSVSETSTANLLTVRGKEVVCPASPHVLAGVMEQQVLDLMTHRGYRVIRRPLFPEDLSDEVQVLLTNSLMGAVPVLTVDGRKTADASALCAALNRALADIP